MTSTTEKIRVQGMICRRCEDIVSAALIQTRGVINAKASYWRGTAEVEYDPEIISRDQLETAIERSGYGVGGGRLSGVAIDIICLVAAAALVWVIMRIKASALPMAEEGVSLGYVFVLGLLTSTHCVAMCGGIMLSQTTGGLLPGEIKIKRSANGAFASLGYNGGRVAAYTLMGAIFGAVGAVISYTAAVKSAVFVIAGLAVAIIGFNMLGLIPGLKKLSPTLPGACALPEKARRKGCGKPLVIGLLTGIMPCAPLQAMWLYAMSTGNAGRGALSMLIFSLGTVPLMFVFGAFSSLIPVKYMKYVLKVSAVLVLALGASMLISGLKLM